MMTSTWCGFWSCRFSFSEDVEKNVIAMGGRKIRFFQLPPWKLEDEEQSKSEEKGIFL